ncbi:cold shock domain-containing protein [Shewanella eurypsychrophilus]|uniref:Cold shock domain-containing protein n=1 Tax=Shewanella eurypsychrophilus TaxID=2593656 RepID=A0ABX6VA44_9GAMM|nr:MULTISPECIES: cold shock domain-containing protein [Shewanella]QFU24297.1 cold shock domain-containing protein [Shewanella sp. YLB-09]QPG59497.1 cold shock domain-containing protein [Shewanella eurypsychrophilus]
MQNIRLTGQLTHWDEGKGLGSIKPDKAHSDVATLHGPASEQIVAIQISALKHMSRQPKVGDCILFRIETKLDSKLNAFDASIQGVAVNPRVKPSGNTDSSDGKTRQLITALGVFSRLGGIVVILLIASYAYQLLSQ